MADIITLGPRDGNLLERKCANSHISGFVPLWHKVCVVSSAHPQKVGRVKGDFVLWRKRKRSRHAIERAPGSHVTAVRGDRWRLRRFGRQ